jgi:two-component system, response regulator YesN
MSYQLLIVDDEVLIRKALSQYIDWESLNCVVHATASNGKEAIVNVIKKEVWVESFLLLL